MISNFINELVSFSLITAVVEMMAAGLVTLAHRSGGPMMDIVVEEESSRNGFLASHDQVLQLKAETISLIQYLNCFEFIIVSLNSMHSEPPRAVLRSLGALKTN
jgi:hypothetical protein